MKISNPITDHDQLSNVTATQHHTKYTDAEAVLAVEAEATVDLTGALTVGVAPSEGSSTPVTDTTEATILANRLYIASLVTIPSTFAFYRITDIEWKNGTILGSRVIGGIMLVDADPPSSSNIAIPAVTVPTLQAGTSSVQKVPLIGNLVVKAGAQVMPFIFNGNEVGKYRYATRTSQNTYKDVTNGASLTQINLTAWGAGTAHFYLKIYYTPESHY